MRTDSDIRFEVESELQRGPRNRRQLNRRDSSRWCRDADGRNGTLQRQVGRRGNGQADPRRSSRRKRDSDQVTRRRDAKRHGYRGGRRKGDMQQHRGGHESDSVRSARRSCDAQWTSTLWGADDRGRKFRTLPAGSQRGPERHHHD